MMNRKVDQLDQCLTCLLDGTLSLEECISRYPHLSEEIKTAYKLNNEIEKRIDQKTENNSQRIVKSRMMNNLKDRDLGVTKSKIDRYIGRKLKWRFSMSWIIILTTLFSLVSGGGIVYASEEALPGDALYPVKTWVEDVRLAIASDERDADLHVQFADKRLEEFLALIESDDVEKIEEALDGYENQTKMLEQTMAKVQAQNPEEAVRLRTALETKLQDQARRMEEQLNEMNGVGIQLQERVREMLATNTQLHNRINEGDDEQVENKTGKQGNQTGGGENDISNEGKEETNSNGAISGNIDKEANAFKFDLNGQGKNGVYAVIDGKRFDCATESNQALCSAADAPKKGNVQLFDKQTNQLLFTYAYEYNFTYEHSWQGEKENSGENAESGSGGGNQGEGGNSNGK